MNTGKINNVINDSTDIIITGKTFSKFLINVSLNCLLQ